MDHHNRLGNLNLNQKTFNNLPLETIEHIVEYLDFESQTRLRRVSHGLRNIVDQVKPSINKLDIGFSKDQNYFKINFLSPYYCEDRETSFIEKVCQDIEFNDMKILLSNPRLQLETFECSENGVELCENDQKLIGQLNSLNHQLEITELTMLRLKMDTMIALLKAIKPGTLEEINIDGGCWEGINCIDPMNINELMDLDQWKQAKRAKISGFSFDFSLHFHHFHRFEEFKISVGSLTLADFLIMRNVFSENPNFKQCFISTKIKPSTEEIEEALGLSNGLFRFPVIGQCKIPNSNEILEFISYELSGLPFIIRRYAKNL
uniref:F-box domain-containing protein n=1 Tax=Caenorhabditis tropicalis TaxID=1561998 RepID=A0A1I7UIA4_9PELO